MRAQYLQIGLDTSTVYDPTKTSLIGDVGSRVINTNTCYSPPPPVLADVFTDTGITVIGDHRYTTNDRLFVISTISAGVATIALYNLNKATGVKSYVGKCTATFPNTAATTHTIRGLRVLDTGTTGWRLQIVTTGSVTVNGGLFVVNNVDLVDFGAISGYAFPLASTLAVTGASTVNAKAVYFSQDATTLGATNPFTVSNSVFVDSTVNHAYVHNGAAATNSFHKHDMTVASPTIAGGVQTMTVTIATPGVVTCTGHGYAANDQVIFVTTGALPTGITAGTVYFVRATNLTANTFEFATTSGGAAVNTTGSQSGTHSVLRAFGITSSFFLLKTGNLPVPTGTILQTGAGNFCNPVDTGNALIDGFPCASYATTTNFYIGRLSELTAGVTTWPSLSTVNLLGGPNQIVTPAATFCSWDDLLQGLVYVTNTALFVFKEFVNNEIVSIFGGVDNTYNEGTFPFAPNLGASAIVSMDMRNGWLLTAGSATGQRVITASFLRSDGHFEYSSLYTPVIPNNGAVATFLSTLEEYFDVTTTMSFAYRVGTLADAQWATESGGTWVDVATAERISIAATEAVQVRVRWDIMSPLTSTPAQLVDLIAGYIPVDENSQNWVGSLKHSSVAGASPFYIAFRLQNEYVAGTVPEFDINIIDDSNNVVQTFNSVADAADIEYTTNDGVSWTPLGTIPNTPLTTEIRVLVSSPPAGKLRARILEVS